MALSINEQYAKSIINLMFKNNRISNVKLAKETGVSTASISNIRSGKGISNKNLDKILHYFKIDIKEFVNYE